MTPTDVKELLNKPNMDDVYLNTAIAVFTEYAGDYCNNTFSDPLPAGVKLFVAKACEYNLQKAGVTSFSMGNVSYSYETDFPPSVLKPLKPYKRLSF
ncbi:phage head-tail connector protein [Virgibacillus siamensis]|uniref:phage head-tail connector protein n=1 Tax=Virgibacillus siamensis TaxID=480071 RepID=UPI000987ADC3|nr:phage head-tail connector protein [Virgibacillus siamensis]